MSDRFCVSTRKGLFTVTRGAGGRWAVTGDAFVGDNVTLSRHDPRSGTFYAALSHGHFGVKLQRSRDGGATWEECGVPEYPERPADAKDVNPMTNEPLPWTLKLVWALAPAHADDSPDALWCGTIPGGLFRSEDAGASWSLVESLWYDDRRFGWFGGGADQPGIHSICVHPTEKDTLTLGVSCGGVWRTTDGGRTWDVRADGMRAAYMPPDKAHDPLVQDPHMVVQCGAAPDHFWAQHHNGIFRSTDGCASWSEIEEAGPSTFGFGVAVHPERPDTAWFVPAIKDEKRIPVDGRLVVTRTRDGGRSFDVLTGGLPQEHAYDLVFRHALAIDDGGDRLAFGSTTGSVFVTEDQGDSWQRVSTHLPPVYAVEFLPD